MVAKKKSMEVSILEEMDLGRYRKLFGNSLVIQIF